MKNLLDPSTVTDAKAQRRRRGPAPRLRRFKQILVPIDFSRPSLKAMPYAVAISRQFGANVHLLHVSDVVQQPPPSLLTLPLVPQSEWNRRLMNRLQVLARKYRTDGNISALEPRIGTAHEEICFVARQLKADLILLATHGYTGYKHMYLGSTAERVVQHSPCPVLVVREHLCRGNRGADLHTKTGFKLSRILVPTDFSECSLVAFEYALQLASDFNAELCLVHVINPHAYPFGDEYVALDPAQLLRETEYAKQKQMRSMATKATTRYSVRVIHGSPAAEICNAANEDADLIVISTHGRTGVGHVVMGSVAEHVVRGAHCPVLVIPVRPNGGKISPTKNEKS